jgi:hypothetical protein
LFGLTVPESDMLPCFMFSLPFTGVNGFFAFSASSRKFMSTEPRNGPFPGWVMMSMNINPCMPP